MIEEGLKAVVAVIGAGTGMVGLYFGGEYVVRRLLEKAAAAMMSGEGEIIDQ